MQRAREFAARPEERGPNLPFFDNFFVRCDGHHSQQGAAFITVPKRYQ